MSPTRKSEFHLRWTTVTYRSVAVTLILIALATGFIMYLIFPDTFRAGASRVGSWVQRGLERVGGESSNKPSTGQQQAKFTAIDGNVRVKKANSNTWISAEFALPLEKGDVVQTPSEGMAKVVFTDGTNYTVKPDSLIVIEENSMNASQQTQVAVQLTTGTVDLTTGTYVQGSKSQVTVSGATASFAAESAAMVRNDPRADEHEVRMKKGSADVVRGAETQHLAEYEKVSFGGDSPRMTKQKEIGPPTLITPANMSPIFIGGPSVPVEFAWTPVENARAYHLRVSRNPFFSSTVAERKLAATSIRIPGLGEGAYYWLVQTLDADGKESLESEHNRFTVIPKGPENVSILLEVEPFIQHGRIIEVKGKTEPGAKVIINGQEAVGVKPDGSFTFFTLELPNGENLITITAQNIRGGVRTLQRKVVIQ